MSAVLRDWCEEHNRGSLAETNGLCPDCEARSVVRKNPFRDRTMAGTFNAVVRCYYAKHKDIWREPGQARPGNAWANNFWRGYDGVVMPVWDAASRRTPAYACFRAGQLVRKAGGCDPVPAASQNTLERRVPLADLVRVITLDCVFMITKLDPPQIVYGAAGRTAAEAWEMFEEHECLGSDINRTVARAQGWRARKVNVTLDVKVKP